MRPFEFLEPGNLGEALAMLAEHAGEARLIAGGQSLLPLLKQRFITPSYLINVKGLAELAYIRRDDGLLRIGAMTTEGAIEKERTVAQEFPILADMESVLAAVQIRNWGTIGGSLAFADTAGDPAPVLIALGATLKAASVRGERVIPVEELQTGYLQTVLEEDEILTEICIPRPTNGSGGAYATFCLRAGDLGVANVAAQVVLDGSRKVKESRIVLGAQSVSPFRAKEAERATIGRGIRDDLEEVGEAVAREAKPADGVTGSTQYKRELAKVLTKRAVAMAMSRAAAAYTNYS